MKKKDKWTKKRRSDLFFVCVMLAFPIFQFCVMWVGVNINSILLAFQEYDINFNVTWGLGNFASVFKDIGTNQEVGRLMVNSVIFWFCTTLVTWPTSLLVSFYFYKRYKHHNIIKTAYYIPSLVSSVVTVTVFYILADRAYPIIMEKLFGRSELGLLVNSDTQFGAIMFYNIFYALAGNFLYFSSAMSTVGEEISEAAQVDGVTPLQELIYITLPSIYPMLSVCFLASLPTIFVSDFGLYAFYKATGFLDINVLGNYFIVGLVEQGERAYPYFSAFGLILSIVACILTFSAKAIIDRMDPFADLDGSKRARRLEKREERGEKHEHEKKR